METLSENTTPVEPTQEELVRAENPNPEPAPGEALSAKKRVWMGIALLAAVLVLAGAAFLGARLLAQGQGGSPSAGGPGTVMRVGRGGGGAASSAVEIKMTPAAEIPQINPEIHGAITGIKDNSLMVTRVKSVIAMMTDDGERSTDFEYDGSAVEVVVTQETQIYKDTTFDGQDLFDQGPETERVFEQTVETVELSDLKTMLVVSVWGYKRGDRLIAETIVVREP